MLRANVQGAALSPEDFRPLAAALAGRFEIERELGRGGMATVYLARDLKRDRKMAGLGDTTRALDWLEQGHQEHSFYMQFLAVDPVFGPLHKNPRFLRMVQDIGLVFPADTVPPPTH